MQNKWTDCSRLQKGTTMKVTNAMSLPEPFVDAVRTDYKHTPDRYSATTLNKGIMQILLERQKEDEITVDVADSIWAIFGSAVHKVLEESQETDTQIKESRLEYEFEDLGMTVSGIFDLYDDATGTVTDYKTATVWKVIYDEWDDYIKQLKVYLFLLRKNGFTNAHTGQIVALLKDHSKAKAKIEMSYPAYPVYVKEWTFTDEEIESVGNELREKLQEIKHYESLPIEQVPPCSPEQRWNTGDKFAVILKGKKRAKRVLDTQGEAETYIQTHGLAQDGAYIEKREGEDKKCYDYCNVCNWCPYFQAKLKNKLV